MEVVDDLSDCPRPPGGTVVTIGAYDGVHIGHQRLIAQVRSMAADRGCASAVVTFDRHPALVVRPTSAPKLLTDLETKLQLLAATGLDYAVVIHFDEARSKEPADDFVRTVLVGCLAARVVVVGHDFHFGHNREGNVAFLEQVGPSLGFEVSGVELFGAGGDAVSSTRIRSALQLGDVELAAELLGRPHLLRGEMVAPREMLVPEVAALPAPGAYAGWWTRGVVRDPAFISVGATGEPLHVETLEDDPAGDGRGAATEGAATEGAATEATVELVARAHDAAAARQALGRA